MASTPEAKYRPTLMLVDGRNLLFRCSHATGSLTHVVDGVRVPTGGLYGFVVQLMRLVHDYPSAKLTVCWESGSCFRYDLFPDYKRRTVLSEPETLVDGMTLRDVVDAQASPLEGLLGLLGVEQWTARNGEADDAIGAITATEDACGGRVLIYSGDGDLRQLVRERVHVLSSGPRGSKLWGVRSVHHRYGVQPERLPEYKAIVGDPSDGIPGVRGVGDVRAKALFRAYGDLEGIIAAAFEAPKGAWVGTESVRKRIVDQADDARLYRTVCTIRTDLPLERRGARSEPDFEEAREVLKRFGCRTIVGHSFDAFVRGLEAH